MSVTAELAPTRQEIDEADFDWESAELDLSPFNHEYESYRHGDTNAEYGTIYEEARKLEPSPFLTDLLHLYKYREPDGSYPDWVLQDMFNNLQTAIYEAQVDHKVMVVEQDQTEDGRYVWMGKDTVLVNAEGRFYHKLPFALARVAVETENEQSIVETLEYGEVDVMLSLKAAGTDDATYEEAESEGFHIRDMIRTSHLATKPDGSIKKVISSIKVHGVSAETWNRMLASEDNMWGKKIDVARENSALAVMEAHEQLRINMADLPGGPLDILRAVRGYATEAEQAAIDLQLAAFDTDQEELEQTVVPLAERWLRFEVDLVESWANRASSPSITYFINNMLTVPNLPDYARDIVLQRQRQDGTYSMDAELAKLVENARRQTLWLTAGILTGDKSTLEQVGEDVACQVRASEQRVRMYEAAGDFGGAAASDMDGASSAASSGVAAGDVCTGESGVFGSSSSSSSSSSGGEPAKASGANRRKGERGEDCLLENITCPKCTPVIKEKVNAIDNGQTIRCLCCEAEVWKHNGKWRNRGKDPYLIMRERAFEALDMDEDDKESLVKSFGRVEKEFKQEEEIEQAAAQMGMHPSQLKWANGAIVFAE